MRLNVTGWKHSKGNFEGRDYDYVVIYCVTKMEQKDTQRGAAGIEMRGEPQLVEKLKKMEFNSVLSCEVETEPRATGKGQFVETVVNITNLSPQAKAA
ncbi:hypothetical protein [Methylobacter tundripaludum]|uniref:hypothetical protein n=1 Tax=Methylobacter tundripaludum TaxID=173365 RepID=UPI0004DFBE8A|nr:hypothetical protein [Methylobacter tundripaludum]